MILERIHRQRKSVAGTLIWAIAMQVALPALAGGKSGAPGLPDTYRKTNPTFFRSPSPAVNKADLPPGPADIPAPEKKRPPVTTKENQIVLQADGPSQPEMSSFKSVGTDNMVDPFSGDFSYNIPLMDVGGYPVNIHYNSNISMDQEASWVGLGWNINPGTISRNMRGLPDDFNGEDLIEKTIHTKPNLNVSVGVSAGIEFFGKALTKWLSPTASLNITYDNYRGYGLETSLGTSIQMAAPAGGTLTGGLSLSNSSTDGAGLTPSISYETKVKTREEGENITHGKSTTFKGALNYQSRAGLTSLSLSMDGNRKHVEVTASGANTSGNTSYSIPASLNFNRPTFTPSSGIPYSSVNFSFNVKTGASVVGMFANLGINGGVSKQYIEKRNITKKYQAYGYLHYSDASGNKNALLDYNRENDGSYIDKITPAIAIPQYTYDVYTISAEGTGGSFRPYRSDAGYIYSTHNKTTSGALNVGVEPGLKHLGLNIKPTYSTTTTNAWLNENKLKYALTFQQKDSIYEDVVFRNPMEMPIQSASYLNSVGHDTLIRPILEGSGVNATAGMGFSAMPNGTNTAYTIGINKPVLKEKREKRNQVISYLDANEASKYGLDKQIYSYAPGYLPFSQCGEPIDTISRADTTLRKAHHLSEITVLNDDGRRYIYGIPAYTISQNNMTFAVKKSTSGADDVKGQTSYTQKEISPDNTSGVDGFFSNEKVPGYAHSFLLSGILSPDYVDVTGDGVSDDDLGNAVKFNYSKIYGDTNTYGWRTPTDPYKASLNEGLKTYSRDDKASIVYGEKEIWYLHSIFSKNMVAVFKVSKNRPDAFSTAGVNGSAESLKQLERLDRIDLYTKADLVNSSIAGKKARPIKSVWFVYDYSLCKNQDQPGSDKGKLTLKKIYFTYNGNDGKKSNPYVFSYNGVNPDYQPKYNDVWGNYKKPVNNPGQLSNIEYPYVVQNNRLVVDTSAAAWCLTDIALPSRGSIKVTYESDDYGFVQNKRAQQFFSLAGLGPNQSSGNSSGTLKSTIYAIANDGFDYRYVFINVPDKVYQKADVASKYLAGVGSVYMKLYIKMPGDPWGSGYEAVPMVCDIEDYGVVNDNRIFIKVKNIEGKNPIFHYAMQFLKENLPSKAYPGSETGDDPNLKTILSALGSQVRNITDMVGGFNTRAVAFNYCKEFVPAKSFIKLSNPTLTKAGGGLRVKRIEVSDNFDSMTSQSMKKAVYGQEYDYTTATTVIENGAAKLIKASSGVASFEPFIGGEENALKGYYSYTQQLRKLGPVSYKFVDTPFCESMFPSASVGYSKVTVSTINKNRLSSNGKEVYTFYTYKDFPTKWSYTPFDDNSRKRHNPGINNFFKINAKHYLTLSQGFKVELNDMHGKMHTHAFYSESDTINPITYTENIYRTKSEQGKPVQLNGKVWSVNGAESNIDTTAAMGQSVEIMTDFREQSGLTISPNIEINVDALFLGIYPLIVPGWNIWPSWERTRFRSASTLKIVNNYGILDSVYQVDKGSVVGTKNLVYDSETGNVILTRTNNEYKDPVYNYNYPAQWAYSGMGMAYKNIHAEFGKNGQVLNMKNGALYYSNNTAFPMNRYFESGDECIVQGFYKADNDPVDPECYFYNNYTTYAPKNSKAWVLDANKNKGGEPRLFFIDEDGHVLNAANVNVKVMRSGKRNFTGSSVGSITMLANPIETVSGNIRIIAVDSQKVVNATAGTFKDCWKVDQSVYPKTDTGVRTIEDSIYLKIDVKLARLRRDLNNSAATFWYDYPAKFMAASAYAKSKVGGIGGCKTVQFRSKAILNVSGLSGIPSGVTITGAELPLLPMTPTDLWPNPYSRCGSYNVNWHSISNWKSASPDAFIGRLLNEYNNFTHYDNLGISTTKVSLNGISNDPAPDVKKINVATLLTEMVANPAAGNNLVLQLHNEMNPDGRYISFFPHYLDDKNKPFNIFMNVHFESQVAKITKTCEKNIKDSSYFNPYRWGVYGNWRPDKSMVYYFDRRNKVPDTATNIRRDGTLDSFAVYWEPLNGKVKPTADTTKWVWNSVVTMVNTKGAEVENADALKRFNSGQYGYNNNLPVAVVQNSRHQESMFDGFEDYEFKNQRCTVQCPDPRFADLVTPGPAVSNVNLDTFYAHTGLYSLKVDSNSTGNIDFALATRNTNDTLPCLNCGVTTRVDSTDISDSVVTGQGHGLRMKMTFTDGSCNLDTVVMGPIGFVAANFKTACRNINQGISVRWEGKLQVPKSGLYRFPSTTASFYTNVRLFRSDTDSVTVYSKFGVGSGNLNVPTIQLYAGRPYKIKIDLYTPGIAGVPTPNSTLDLKWRIPGSQVDQRIPAQYLYTPYQDTTGSLQVIEKWCYKINAPYVSHAADSILLPKFQPFKGSAVMVTAWVKESVACTGASYTHAKLIVSFDAGSARIDTLRPTGVVIEGWQRMESDSIPVPLTAGKLQLRVKSDVTGIIVNMDDIRIHPYNANMKSFVYNPLNLRLMAELDENNYASFYEYDDEGTLVRVKKETEKGIKTIKETRSALYKTQ